MFSCFFFLFFFLKGKEKFVGFFCQIFDRVSVAEVSLEVECLATFFPTKNSEPAIEMVGGKVADLLEYGGAVGGRCGFLFATHCLGAPVKMRL